MSVAVTYNDYELPNIFGKFGFRQDYNKAVFSCNFRVEESSASALVAECKDAEAALRKPYQNLLVQFDGNTELSFSHDDNTGLNISPSISKIEDEQATETSRAYHFECSLQLPADLEDFNFRQSASFDISEDPSSLKTVTFNVVYTASPSPSEAGSFANFVAHAETYTNSVISTMSENFELISKKSNTGDQDKFTSGTLVYKEIGDNQAESAIDDPDIKNVSAVYRVEHTQEQDIAPSSGFQAPNQVRVFINYTAKIAKSVAVSENSEADFGRQSIAQKYQEIIRPWLIEHSFDVLNLTDFENAGNEYIIERDSRQIDPFNRTVSGTLVLFCPKTFGEVLAVSETLTTKTDRGKILRKLWNRKKDSYYRYNIGSSTFVSRNIMVYRIGGEVDIPELTGNLEIIEDSRTVTQKNLGEGLENGSEFTNAVTATRTTISESYVVVDRTKLQEL